MSENVKKWYVVRAISGNEKKVKQILENEISNLKLQDYISQVLIPMEKAQITLGLMHEKGYGVAKNVTEACNWYKLAAANGSQIAQKKLVELGKGNAFNDSKFSSANQLALDHAHAHESGYVHLRTISN